MASKPAKATPPEGRAPVANSGRFQKGQSGNPGGAPKGLSEVRDLARTHTTTAMTALVSIASSNEMPPAARVSAATALLDRGWGKAAQPIGGTDELPPIRTVELTEARLLAIAAGDG